MNRPGEELFARPALALEKDVRVVLRHLPYDMKNTLHFRGFSEYVVKTEELVLPFLQHFHFLLQGPGFPGQEGVHDGVVVRGRRVFHENIQKVDLVR